MLEYSIQELSDQTKLPRRTIHFYVQQGLLPPPTSAGVGARYTEVHLLCLQLIPLLRRRGMKLDDIRDFLKNMDITGLHALYAQEQQPATPTLPVTVSSQPFAHYQLPAGITITAPASLSPADRNKLAELLKPASAIFSK